MKFLKYVITWIIGIITGCTICIAIGTYLYYCDPYTIIKGKPKKFGDLKIAVENSHKNESFLVIAKGDISFFYALKDKSGKINHVTITNGSKKNNIVFNMKSSENAKKWEKTAYGNLHKEGYYWMDGNFDGQFDVRKFFDSNGVKRSTSLLLEDYKWNEVDNFKNGKGFIKRIQLISATESNPVFLTC
jgi:hypothetical protein